jgi:hypothetical protein
VTLIRCSENRGLTSPLASKGSDAAGWEYHFVLVRQKTSFDGEDAAADAAAEDLTAAF